MTESQHQPSSRPDINVPDHLRSVLHEREKICAELEALAGNDDDISRCRADQLRELFRNAEALPPEYAEIMDRRFAEAEHTYEAGIATAAANRERREKAAAAMEEAKNAVLRIAAEKPLLPHRRELDKAVKNYLAAVAAAGAEADPLLSEVRERAELRLREEETAAANALVALREAVTELEALQAANDPDKFKERREALEAIRNTSLPALDAADEEGAKLAERCRELLKDLNAKLVLHFQTLDLARWESYTLKLDLCKELETMQTVDDAGLPAVSTRLREIRKRWQELGAVPREKQSELGPKFYEYTTSLQHRIDEFYKKLRAEHAEVEAKKIELIAKAEALADSTEWNVTTEAIKGLQAEWKNAGHAGREADTKLYATFRAACDKFFNARTAYWESKHEQHAAATAAKIALCEAAETLAGREGAAAVAEAKKLRADFQAAPRAGKAEAELSNRFNAAMDTFFGRRREEVAGSLKRREEIVEALEAFAVAEAAAAEKTLRELREEWQQLPNASRESTGKLEVRARAAATRIEKAIGDLRRKQQAERGLLFAGALREVAKLIAAARAGEPLPEVTIDLSPFPKLATLATELVAGSAGLDAVEKAIRNNTREFRRLLEEIESALAPKEKAPVADLAAELAAAIAGNFGGSAVRELKRAADPRELARKLLGVGMVELGELDELLERYEKIGKHTMEN